MLQVSDEAQFRLRLAEGFLREARQDMDLHRWHSCVDNSQLAIENAGKVALALLGPVGRTHNPAPLLRQALADSRFPALLVESVAMLVEYSELLGPDVHALSDYGDEASGATPSELFTEEDARYAGSLADAAVVLAKRLVAVA